MASIRPYLDEDVRPLLAEILRDRGYDAVSAARARHCGLTDQEQLQTAIDEKRLLVSHNIRDFVRLRRLLYFLSQETAASVQGQLFWLSAYEPPR